MNTINELQPINEQHKIRNSNSALIENTVCQRSCYMYRHRIAATIVTYGVLADNRFTVHYFSIICYHHNTFFIILHQTTLCDCDM